MQYANYKKQPYPTEKDIEIWVDEGSGEKEYLTKEYAKSIPIIRLKSNNKRAEVAQ